MTHARTVGRSEQDAARQDQQTPDHAGVCRFRRFVVCSSSSVLTTLFVLLLLLLSCQGYSVLSEIEAVRSIATETLSPSDVFFLFPYS